MIARILHQIWLGPEPLPDEFAAYRETWRAHHPAWELRLWTEESLPADIEHREVYELDRSPAERSDIARLHIVHRFGGVYLDTDFECLKPIDLLLEGTDFFVGMLKEDRANNAAFGAAAGHPLLARALQELTIQEKGGLFDKTASGALFFDRLLEGREDVRKFPPVVFYPATADERLRAVAVHHYARSWKTGGEWRETALRAEERLDQAKSHLDEALRTLEVERWSQERLRRSMAELEQRLAGRSTEDPQRLKLLFFLRSINYGRVFENFLRGLLQRGHELHVVLTVDKLGPEGERSLLFEELVERYDFTFEQIERRSDGWLRLAVGLRHSLDYLRYLEPEFAHAEPLRARARARAPAFTRMLARTWPFRGARGRRWLVGALRKMEAAVPVPASARAVIEQHGPDAVLVAPLVGLGSIESDYLRAAQEAGIPTVLPVASWDNLTNKGVLHAVPTLTIVWNEAQVEEAVRLHRVPRHQVVAVGAHSFDHWFSWEPSSSREDFARRVGLDPSRPLILYLGSSGFIAGDETGFIRAWLTKVRAHPRLRDAAVLLRAHPQNTVGWTELGVSERGKTAVWPHLGTAPTDDRKKADFFDSLYHADAVVGLNTSALIEASILGKPVLTKNAFATQGGTLHFSYLTGNGNGDPGPVKSSPRWAEHLAHLAAAIERPEEARAGLDEFVTRFVRPRGREVPSAPAAVAAVERAARARTAPVRQGRALRPLLRVFRLPLTFVLGSTRKLRVHGPVQPAPYRANGHPGNGSVDAETRRKVTKSLRRARSWRERAQHASDAAAHRRAAALRREAAATRREAEAMAREAAARERTRAANEQLEAARHRANRRARLERRRADRARQRSDRRTREAAAAKAERANTLDREAAKLVRKASGAPKAGRPKRRRPRGRGLPQSLAHARSRMSKRSHRIAHLARRRWKHIHRRLVGLSNMRHRRSYRATLSRVPARDELPAVLNARRLLGTGVEVGVKTGNFSERLLENWKGKLLISVDPWLAADPDDYRDRSNVSQDRFEEFYEQTVRRLDAYGSRSEIRRATSLEAAAEIDDASLDFVYIDARHDFESVLEDLGAWFPKVRPGGIIAGHDYVDGFLPQGDFGVKSAVDEFFGERALEVHSTDGPSAVEMFPSWIVEVPRP